MNRLRLLKRGAERMHAEELGSLFVVSLPRSLSSLLYIAAARAIGLVEPSWTSDGEILNRDRVPRRKQSLVPADERFTLLGSAPDIFANMTSYLDRAALRQGFAYKDVLQPFVIGGWEGLGDFKVLKVRRNVAEVAYTMLKRQWLYPARAASVFEGHPWSLVEGLVRAEAVLDALPGETVDYAHAVLDHDPLEAALGRLYPDAPLAPPRYIDRSFDRTRRRLEAERRSSLVFRQLEWIVSAVQEQLRFDDPREEIAEALP
ncbi:MAG TPA: hypothetical protein VIC70_00230 [Gaiellaceae bacterium]